MKKQTINIEISRAYSAPSCEAVQLAPASILCASNPDVQEVEETWV